jgi:tripartite-type tricarboxylate transporter receptor subunit TctC
MKLIVRAIATALLVASIVPATAGAKYPDAPITLVVGFPPGGSNDIIARIIAPVLSKNLSVGVVVDNKPGADAAIGTNYTVRAKPDGYTITLGSASPMAINPTTIKNLPYNPETDLAAITTVANSPGMIAVNPAVPAQTLQDLIALSKTRSVTMASSGAGGLAHLTIEMLKQKTGGGFMHVPYKGATPAINDVVGGHVDGIIMDYPALTSFVSSNQLRALALLSDKMPSQPVPGKPPLGDSVVPQLVSINWFIVMAPAKTPQAVLATLHDALVKTMNDPAVQQQLARLGYLPMTNPTPQAAQAFLKTETDRWRSVAQAAHLQAE